MVYPYNDIVQWWKKMSYLAIIKHVWTFKKLCYLKEAMWIVYILYNSNSGNRKTIETVNKSVIATGLEVKYKGIFRTVKLFCMTAQWWIYDIMHWSKPIELYSTKSES